MIRLSASEIARLSKAAQKATKKPVLGAPAKKRKKLQSDDTAGLLEPAKKGRLPRIVYDGEEIRINLNVAPQPKERARTFADERALVRAFLSAHGDVKRFVASVKARSSGGEGSIMRSFTPDATRRFEDIVALLVRRAMSDAQLSPFDCPLELGIEFRLEGDDKTWPTANSDGDLDNLQKSLKDALNGVAWVDDRLVVCTMCIKICSPRFGISFTLRPARPHAEFLYRMANGQFEFNQEAMEALRDLRAIFKVDDDAAVLLKVIALAKVAASKADSNRNVTISGSGEPLMISLGN